MVILITGATHTGKTGLAQKLMEKCRIPYVSEDHIKMGLIRSHYTDLTVEDDGPLTEYLWPMIREMIKTAIENGQNLIVEGCYIPFHWREEFGQEYLSEIRYICLCMSERYIETHLSDIRQFASSIERRLDDGYCTRENLLRDNRAAREGCARYALEPVMIDTDYTGTIDRVLEQFNI